MNSNSVIELIRQGLDIAGQYDWRVGAGLLAAGVLAGVGREVWKRRHK